MKLFASVALLSVGLAALTVCLPFRASAEGLEVTPDALTVVTEAKTTPAANFAAKELSKFLARAYGRSVATSHAPASNSVSIVIGDTAWSRAAGIDVSTIERDSFVIRVDAVSRRVYIAGRDSGNSPEAAIAHGGYPRVECATLYGAYAFLEKFYGCRFYFPGEIGEIVPKAADKMTFPAGDYGQKPVFTVRYVYLSGDGEGYLAPTNKFGNYSEKSLNWLRLRMETKVTPCCHGLNSFRYVDRFLKDHPEYFALQKDGATGQLRRDTDPKRKLSYHFGQLCHSSGVRDVLADDVRKRFAAGAEFVDVMPQDGFAKCLCPECQAAYVHPEDRDYASELVWGKTAELARGLQRDGVQGMLTMMAYGPYRRIPDFDIPTNVLVMVAEQGPWQKVRPEAFRKSNDEVKGWAKKMGRKVWVWTYPHKYGQSAIPTLPQMTPRAWGEYYKALQPWIFGSFAETESDKWIYNYLNYYMFSRIAWDEKADIDAILDEHYRLMFGAAVDDMRAFYELLEKTWLEGMQGNVDDTPVGPVARIPPPLTIWREIYSPEMIRRCSDSFVRAAGKLDRGTMEFRRVKFIKEQFLDPLRASSRNYLKGVSVEDELKRRADAKAVNLVGRAPDAVYYGGKQTPPREGGVLSGSDLAYRLDRDYAYVEWTLDLKPETTYRISYFLKAKDLFKREDWKGCFGGATVEFSDGVNELRNPTPFEDGTFDWIHRSFVITTPAKEKMSKKPYVRPWMLHGRGIAWFDGFCVEEVKKETK